MTIRDIFQRIAERLGLSTQPKNADCNYHKADDVNLTAAVANRITTLTMLDSDIAIIGDNARAKFMASFLEEYVADRMSVAAETSLGTGDCLVKPWTDGERIGVDIVSNEDFRVCESIGNYIKSVIIRADKAQISGKTYTRYEGQRLENIDGVSMLFIDQFVYCDTAELTNVSDWPVAWREIKQQDYIPNVDQLLLGRYKCPTVNREDVNSEAGVKVTYGLDPVMDYAAEAYVRFNEEQKKKESMLFVDKTLLRSDAEGNRILPQGKNKLFQASNMRDSKSLVYEYSPDMRTDELEHGVEVNFKMLELLAGFSAGVLSTPTTSFATATEMKASLQLTYAFMTKFRKQLVKGTDELLRAVDVICNRNGITPMGVWEAKYDWSSSYIENLEEQFERLMQAEAIGAVSTAEVRAYAMDEDIETAKAAVAEIKNEGDNGLEE